MGDRFGVPAFIGIKTSAAWAGAFLDVDGRLVLTGAMISRRLWVAAQYIVESRLL